MSLQLVSTEPVIPAVLQPPQRDQAHLATRTILDSEITALQARLLQRRANASASCTQARDDLTRQISWLQQSLTKLETRRDALC